MRYRAFLSYRSEDLRQAVWLQSALERFRTPRALIGTSGLYGPVPARLGRIFRDRDEARTADDIETLIAHELKRSEQLIVLCTPGAVAPGSWVPREIELFRNQRPGAPIHAVIGKGEPPAVFPQPLLRPRADGERAMPLAADLRKRGGDGKRRALAKLVAGIIGVEFDDLWQRERSRRWRRLATVTLLLLASGIVGLLMLRQAAARDYSRLANLATLALNQGEYLRALRWAVSAVPASRFDPTSPSVPDAVAALRRAVLASPLLAALGPVGKPVQAVAISADGHRIAIGSATGGVFLLGPSGREVLAAIAPATRSNGAGRTSLAFSRDGSFLAASGGFDIRIIGRDGTLLATQKYPSPMPVGFSSLTVSADGAYIIASRIGEIWVFDAKTGAELRHWQTPGRAISLLAASPDASRIIACGVDGSIVFWSVVTGEKVQELPPHGGSIIACGYDRQGQHFFSSSTDGVVRVYNAGDAKASFEWNGVGAGVTYATFSPDGKQIAFGTGEGIVLGWTYGSAEKPARLQVDGGAIRFITYAREGRSLIAVSAGGYLAAWSVSAGNWPLLHTRLHAKAENYAASADGEQLLSSGNDDSPALWRTSLTRESVELMVDERNDIHAGLTASGTALHNLALQKEARRRYFGADLDYSPPPAPTQDSVRQVVSSGDLARTVILRGARALVMNRDGKQLTQLAIARTAKPLLTVLLSADGRRVVGLDADAAAPIVWDGTSGQRLAHLEQGSGLSFLTLSVDGKLASGGSRGGWVGLWELSSGRLLRRIDTGGENYNVQFSPDASLLAVARAPGITLYRVADGARQARTDEPGTNLVMSTDNRYLASEWDGSISLWDTRDGRMIGRVDKPTNSPLFLAFSHSGQHLGIATMDGTSWAWRLAPVAGMDAAELRRGACADILRYVAAFTDADVAAGGVLTADREMRNPCLARGPFSSEYYRKLVTQAVAAPSPIHDNWPLVTLRTR